MIDTKEKIYYAKQKWDCSFEELAYLLEMDKKLVKKLYHQELAKQVSKITIDSEINNSILPERTKNCLFRHHIRTIRDLITYPERFDAIPGLGQKSVDKITEARRIIATVLNLNIQALIAAFSTGGVVIDVNWVNSEPNHTKIITKWEVVGTKIENVKSITGRMKGYLKTIKVNVWLDQED